MASSSSQHKPPSASGGASPSPSIEQLLPRLRQTLQASLDQPPIAVTNHSVVFKSFSHAYRDYVAVKIINKKALPPAVADKFLPRELEVTSKVSHPHLCRCLWVLEPCPSKMVIVSEYYAGGTLLSLIHKEGKVKELPQGVRMFRQLIEAMHYLHQRGVVHRDIKLENILLDQNGDLRLADFGFARFCQRRERSKSFCGTRPYSAPQITRYKAYDSYAADWFAAGVVLYTMLIGKWPKDPPPAAVVFPEDGPSEACQWLIRRLMAEDENERAGYEECLYSEWMSHQPHWVFADRHFVYEVLDKPASAAA